MPSKTFREIFGHEPTVDVDAPGRVNLIGEHTGLQRRIRPADGDPRSARACSAAPPGA